MEDWLPDYEMKESDKNRYNTFGMKNLYTCFVKRILSALHSSMNQGIHITLGGLIWYQGESDARSSVAAEKYMERIKLFLDKIMNNVPSLKPIPKLIIAISSPKTVTEYVDSIRSAQISLKDAKMNIHIVDSAGLELQKDGPTHLSSKGARALGNSIGEVVNHITKGLSFTKDTIDLEKAVLNFSQYQDFVDMKRKNKLQAIEGSSRKVSLPKFNVFSNGYHLFLVLCNE